MDRLFRFSFPGIAFLFTTWFFILALTGENYVIKLGISKIPDLLAVLVSTPIIGLILTSFLHALLHSISWKRPGPYWYYLPATIKKRVFKNLSPTKLKPKTDQDWRAFYWNYQAYQRQKLTTATLDFLTRRWTYCFIHVNNVFASFADLAISVTYRLMYVPCSGYYFNYSLFLVGLTILILYSTTGLYLAYFAWNDARNVEHRAVNNSLKERTKGL